MGRERRKKAKRRRTRRVRMNKRSRTSGEGEKATTGGGKSCGWSGLGSRRGGSKGGTDVFVQDTIEDRILRLQEKKRLVFESTVGRSSEALAKLTEADMKFLFS